jgi:GAF domain-containing protein
MASDNELFQKQVQALLAIAEAMNASLGRQAALEQTLSAIVRELGYRAALLRLLNAEKGTLDLTAAYGLSQDYLNKGQVRLPASGLDQRVFAGETVALHDMSTDPGLQYPDAAAREGLRSVLALPLRLGGKVIGVLRIFTDEAHEFTPDERAFLEGVANLAARAVANAVLYDSFHRIAHEVNSTLEVTQVLRRLLHSLIDELNVKAASVRLVGPNHKRLHLAASEGLSEDYLNKGEIRIADSPIDQKVLGQGRPVTVYDVATEQALQYGQAAAQEGIRSVLAVPLRVRDQLIGVLRVYSAQPHRFTAEETALVEALADLGGLALENARLHEALSEKYEAAREDWSGWYRFLTLS